MILGIDPGLANLGWAILDDRLLIVDRGKTDRRETENRETDGRSETSDARGGDTDIRLVAAGVIKTKNKETDAARLGQIYAELEKLIEEYGIKAIAIETLFFARNTTSALPVAEAIGVIKLCGQKHGLEVAGYTPLQVKMALVGYGRAEKEQVETMVKAELGIKGDIRPSHASDAAAVGLTHLFMMKV